MLHRRSESPRRRAADHPERLSEAGMVDLLGMFRRRAPKRGPQGFERSHEDITALGDRMGDMLTQPVRDAPPIAREVLRDTPAPKTPRAEKTRPRAAVNGAAPRLATKAGYL